MRVAGRHSEFGQYAIIDHRINGRLVSTLYAHMIVGSSHERLGLDVAAFLLSRGRKELGSSGATTTAQGRATEASVVPWRAAACARR